MSTINLSQAEVPVNTEFEPIRVNWPGGKTTFITREEPAQSSRRQFLGQAAALMAGVPVAGLPKEKSFPGKLPDGYILVKESDLESVPDAPPPFGPAERTAVIDDWAARIDKALVALESLHGFVLQARALPQAEVDGLQLFNLEKAAFDQMNRLSRRLESLDYEQFFEALTGQREYLFCIKQDIASGERTRAHFQLEVDVIRKYDPTGADELQAFLDAHLPA